MTGKDYEAKIQKDLDPNFSVVENPNRPGLSNIFYYGKNYDLPVISTHLIKEIVDPTHRYQFPNGMYARLWAEPEITERLVKFLDDYKKGEYEEYE